MKELYYKLGALGFIVILLIYGGFILKPVVLGLFLAMLAYPFINYLEKFIKSSSIRYFLTMILFFSIVLPITLTVGFQILKLFSELESDKFSFEILSDSLYTFFTELGISSRQTNNFIATIIDKFISFSADLVPSLISNGSSLMVTLIFGFIFSYFFSIYYLGLKEAFLDFFHKSQRQKIENICNQVPQVIRNYLTGMGAVMLLLAIINTLIYTLIGLEYALVWGILSGILALIPYIGSGIALLLPLSYSIIVSDGITQPLIILFSFIIVQQLEGNVFTPKIVGDKVNINPLAAIIFMIVSAQIWGIFGIFISIMVAGILKIVFEQWREYRTLAVLLSETLEEK